jgi:hypothetical protein
MFNTRCFRFNSFFAQGSTREQTYSKVELSHWPRQWHCLFSSYWDALEMADVKRRSPARSNASGVTRIATAIARPRNAPQQSRRLRFPASVPPASVSAVVIANHGQKVQKAIVRQ